MHILGFDASMYSTYLDPATARPYSYTIVQNINLHTNRANNNILKTPFVTAWAIDFFACTNMTGMALENEEGGAGVSSHWERLAMYD